MIHVPETSQSVDVLTLWGWFYMYTIDDIWVITFACGQRKMEGKKRIKRMPVGNRKIQSMMSGMDVRY